MPKGRAPPGRYLYHKHRGRLRRGPDQEATVKDFSSTHIAWIVREQAVREAKEAAKR